MDISIVIVSWNAAKHLKKCLESLREETRRCPELSTETIVIDNASSDGSAQIVAEEFPGFKLVRNDRNLGFARANNIGILMSKGKYLLLINSDVVLKPDCVRNIYRYLEAYPEIGILGPQIIDERGAVQRSCMGFPTAWNTLCRALALDALFPRSALFGGYLMPYWPHDTTRKVEVINGCFWAVRRSAMETVGLLDETFFMYGEDMDWCRRFRLAGWPAVFFPGARAIHFGGASSALAPVRFYIEKQKANLGYWRKHHGPQGEAVAMALMIIHESARYGAGLAARMLPGRKRSFNVERSKATLKWLIGLGTQMLRPQFIKTASGGDCVP